MLFGVGVIEQQEGRRANNRRGRERVRRRRRARKGGGRASVAGGMGAGGEERTEWSKTPNSTAPTQAMSARKSFISVDQASRE